MTEPDQLHIEMKFSRELAEHPDFAEIATRAFNRELNSIIDGNG
jgi:hypothetical protein